MERITLIKKVLQELEKQGVRYCVLRNYNFLLEGRNEVWPSEKSVDMVVSREDFNLFEKIMVDFSFLKRKPQFSRAHQAYFRIEELEPISFDVQVGGAHWNDMCYLDEKLILGNRVKKLFFYIPGDNDTFIMLVAHSILGKRYFKKEYQEKILQLASLIEVNYVRAQLHNIFNAKITGELLSLIQKNKFEKIMMRKEKYILTFLLQKKRLFTFIPLALRWIRWKRFLQPYPLISIIGPDGAGKSTLVLELHEHLKRYKRKAQVVYTGRGRGQLLPFRKLGNAYKHREKQQDTKQPSSLWKRKIFYTAAAPLFALDLWLRYWLKIMPLRKCRTIVITDRYCTDILLIEHVPLWFKKFLFRLFPKPTMTFYLYNSAKVLHERRPKESIPELERQMQLFERMLPYLHARKIVTNEKEKVQEEVIITVLEYIYKEWY
ncbi:MAG TPA: hypothetical protein VJI32_06165 [Candidatus Nanoarchaeia archaeon]|nr:hypothetical protein [Candidatus Nanoarchaeia archaeon]